MTFYDVTVAHAVPPNFTYGLGLPLSLGEPTYYEAMRFATGLLDEPKHLLEVAWTIGNVDDPDQLPDHLAIYTADAHRYRELGNRSLSVGDIVVLTNASGSQAWICAPVGWHAIEPPEVIPTSPRAELSAARNALNAR